jgi:WD40 repeat protein
LKPDSPDLPPGAVALFQEGNRQGIGEVHAVAFSLDGKMLATAGGPKDRWFHLWNARGQNLHTLALPEPGNRLLAFSPDGKVLAVVGGVTENGKADVHTVDTSTGKRIGRFEAGGPASALAFSADGKRLALGDETGMVTIWDARTGKPVRQLKTNARNRIHLLAFVGDNDRLVVASEDPKRKQDTRLHVYDAAGKELVSIRIPAGDALRALAVSPDGKTLAYAEDLKGGGRRLSLCALETGKTRATMTLEGPGPVQALAFSPDGKHLTWALDDGQVKIFDATTGKETQVANIKSGIEGARVLALSPDGQFLASGGTSRPRENPTLQMWLVEKGKLAFTVPGREGYVQTVAFSPDGKLLAAGSRSRILVWEVATRKEAYRLTKAPEGACRVAFSPDGVHLAAAGSDRRIWVWNAADGDWLHALRGPAAEVSDLAFTPDSKRLFTAGRDTGLFLWDAVSGKELRQRSLPPSWPLAVAPSPDGKSLSTLQSNGVVRWEQGFDSEVVSLQGAGRPDAAAFSPDGLFVAVARGHSVGLWEVASGKSVLGLTVSSPGKGMDDARCLSFSRDGVLLAAGTLDGAIVLWEAATGKEMARFTGPAGTVSGLAFTRDGRLLASAGEDGSVFLWDLASAWNAQRQLPPPKLTLGEAASRWDDLLEDDATVAYRAMSELAGARAKAVTLLKQRLRPLAKTLEEHLKRLIVDLDDDDPKVRDRASKELESFGSDAEKALYLALAKKPSAEVQARARAILDHLSDRKEFALAGESLRQVRAVQVLERIGTPEARELLETLSKGPSGTWPTHQAKQALARLALRPGP